MAWMFDAAHNDADRPKLLAKKFCARFFFSMLDIELCDHRRSLCANSMSAINCFFMPKTFFRTQSNANPSAHQIATFTTKLSNCNFSPNDFVASSPLQLATQNQLNLTFSSTSGPKLIRLFEFECSTCSNKKENLVLRITETMKAFSTSNLLCKPSYSFQNGYLIFQALNGCENLSIDQLFEVLQTGAIKSQDPYMFSKALAAFKLQLKLNGDTITRDIALNGNPLLVSPCKVALKRSIKQP